MTNHPPHLVSVIEQAKEIFGRDVDKWLHKPSRNLADLTPFEMAQCPEGARVVLAEMDQHRELA